jgi:hypothetical protein
MVRSFGYLMLALVLSVPLGLMALPATDANACGNALVMVEDESEATLVKRAERYLKRGKYAEALSTISQTYWELTKLDELYKTPEKIKRTGKHHKPALVVRAARVAALSLIRTNGRMTFDEYPGRVRAGSDKRLMWAIGVIEHLYSLTPEDVELRNYRAEALAAQPEKKAEALAAFDALERANLLLDSSKEPLARLRAGKSAVADDGKNDPRPRSAGAKGADGIKDASLVRGPLGNGGPSSVAKSAD